MSNKVIKHLITSFYAMWACEKRMSAYTLIMPDLGHSVAQKQSTLAKLRVLGVEIPLARWPMGTEAAQCGGI